MNRARYRRDVRRVLGILAALPVLASAGPAERPDLLEDTFHVTVVGDRVYFGSSVDHQMR